MKSSLQVFVAVCLLMVQTAFSQTITLSFTGCTNHREYVQLDSVRVENLTRNWTEKLIYPDTVLILDDQTSVSEVTEDVAKCISYPNPFHGTSHVVLTLPQSEQVTLLVYNLEGQRMLEKHVQVEAGESHFEINLNHPQVYFLIVQTSHGKIVQKLINVGHSGGNSIKYSGTQTIMPAKTHKLRSSKPFQRGDSLKVNGYVTFDGVVIVNDDMIQAQWVDESYILYFVLQDKDIPVVVTDTVISIMDTSAVGGGNVINDGKAFVTARGICWDTLHNPTISNSHTIDGSGIGMFTSYMTGLKPNTTYYVRAYATNSEGTAYGNEVTFTTIANIKRAVFSVSATDSVEFSPGNLQWSATNGGNTPTTHVVAGNGTAAGTWRFAPNQWDTIGANNSNVSSTYTGWIDLFGWGTSGWNNGNYFYQPYSTSSSTSAPYTSTIGNGYGPTDGSIYSYSLTGAYANSDWGVYNAIYNPRTNSTDAPGTWRTPTSNEWNYLLFNRNTASGIRYAKATVNGVTGLIIVPDNWNASTYALNSTNMGTVAFTSNIISAANWTTLENAGAIFLPAAGSRLGTYANTADRGYYWSVTCLASNGANAMVVISSNVHGYNGGNRYTGRSVRLVRSVSTPAPGLPIVITDTISNLTDTTAVGGGNVINDGGVPVNVRGICWDTIPYPTINKNNTVNGSGTGSFTSNISGLKHGTTYYVRAYATNSVGTAYGNEVSFTTISNIKRAVFSVSATDSVEFSPGNLQWSATNGGNTSTTHAVAGNGTAAGTWRFAPNQWDTIGANNNNISSSYTGWIDLFGWGTSGWNNGNYFYQPYSTSSSTSAPYTNAVGNGYGPTDGSIYSYSLTGTYANSDWGVYNAIYNPKTNTTDAPGTWRTPTSNEWNYLLCNRNTASGIRYAKATVNGVTGLIVVPDNWNASTYALDSTNMGSVAFTSNVISAAKWTVLEKAGAIFLPAAGDRLGTYTLTSDRGYYWSVTCYDDHSAYSIVVIRTNVQCWGSGGNRFTAKSVRLVKDVK